MYKLNIYVEGYDAPIMHLSTPQIPEVGEYVSINQLDRDGNIVTGFASEITHVSPLKPTLVPGEFEPVIVICKDIGAMT